MLGYVYPALGCSGTLIACVNSQTPAPVPDVVNPIQPTGPVKEPFARMIYCAMSTVGLSSLYCSIGPEVGPGTAG